MRREPEDITVRHRWIHQFAQVGYVGTISMEQTTGPKESEQDKSRTARVVMPFSSEPPEVPEELRGAPKNGALNTL